jgi:hypothetical protein
MQELAETAVEASRPVDVVVVIMNIVRIVHVHDVCSSWAVDGEESSDGNPAWVS